MSVMTPPTTQLITGGGCCLLVVLALLFGFLAFKHMSRRDSADDIGPDVQGQELAQGFGRLIEDGRIVERDRRAS